MQQFSTIWMSLWLSVLLLSTGKPQIVWAQRQSTPLLHHLAMPHTHTTHHATLSSTSFFTLLGAGFLTGLSHCIGMCGPLVGAFVLRRRAVRQELTASLVLFQLGRLTMYGVIGIAAGSIGAAFAATLSDWQGLFAVTMGLLAIGMGVGLLGVFPLQKCLGMFMPLRILHVWMTARMASSHPAAPFTLGLANGCLPCGPLYAAASLAVLSADPFQGGSLMLLFGFGTLPWLLTAGFAMVLVSVGIRQGLYRLAAFLVVLAGVQITLRGLALYGYVPHAVVGGVMLW